MNLSEFLLARIAEDEAVARAAMVGFPTGEWTDDGGIYAGHPTREVVDWVYEDARPHIARWDPARVLAECEAKRRIVEGFDCYTTTRDAGWMVADVFKFLALPYADHPDYDEGWRP